MIDPVQIGSTSIGDGKLALIAGPCAIEGEEMALQTARTLADLCAVRGVPYVFKASFDKANRTSGASGRGVGMEEGLRILARIRDEIGCPVTTDIHTPDQADPVARVVDLLQIPAFLCRQTDLLRAAGHTGRPVNVKKGQFVAPLDMAHAVEKLTAAGAGGVLLTERGTMLGYHDLVVDFRSIPQMRSLGVPVVFDATHSTQRPAAHGDRSGGDASLSLALGRAAVAVGADAIFAEVHPDPPRAISDPESQLPLVTFAEVLDSWLSIARPEAQTLRSRPSQ